MRQGKRRIAGTATTEVAVRQPTYCMHVARAEQYQSSFHSFKLQLRRSTHSHTHSHTQWHNKHVDKAQLMNLAQMMSKLCLNFADDCIGVSVSVCICEYVCVCVKVCVAIVPVFVCVLIGRR